MEIIPPIRQKAWGWPAALNFILGGMGSGFYLLSLLTLHFWGEPFRIGQGGTFEIIGPVLTVLGLAVLGLEAHRPWRSRYLLSHLQHSWMSRETLAAVLFVSFALLDVIFPSAALRWSAAVAAAAFLFSQSLLVYRARGVATWNLPLVPAIFLASGFFSGSGLLLMTSAWGGPVPARIAGIVSMALLVINLWIWMLYLNRSRSESLTGPAECLLRPVSLMLTVGLGHLLPGLLLLTLLVTSPERADQGFTLMVVAGGNMIVGCAAQKVGILLKAGYLRGIAFDRRAGAS